MNTNEAPDLPDDWGLMKAICADGQHRFLVDSPKCGCGKQENRVFKYRVLEQDIIKIAKEWREMRIMQGGTTRTLTRLLAAVEALVDFGDNL